MKNLAFMTMLLLLVDCSSEQNSNLTQSKIKKAFQSEFYTYEFVSSTIDKIEDNMSYVTVNYRKPFLNKKLWSVKQTYRSTTSGWAVNNSGIEIDSLPPLKNHSEKNAKFAFESRLIEIDTTIYIYDSLLTPYSDKILSKAVIDVIFKGKSISDQKTSILEGEKVSLILNE